MRVGVLDSAHQRVGSFGVSQISVLFWGFYYHSLYFKVASFCVCRGIVLEPPCPRRVDGISIDPEPNSNFDSLLSEIESVEKKLNVFSKFPQPFTQTTLGYISLSLSLCLLIQCFSSLLSCASV